MEIGNIAKYNKGFRYLLNCIDIYTVGNKTNGKEFLRRSLTEYKTNQVRLFINIIDLIHSHANELLKLSDLACQIKPGIPSLHFVSQ